MEHHNESALDKSNSTVNIPHQMPHEIVQKLELYYTPILVLFGVFGNSVSVYIFFKSKLKKHSSSYYLAALGVSDTIFLVALFIHWLNWFQINISRKPIICHMLNYFSYMCSFLSVWLVVTFTVERFIAVRYPLLRASICTAKRAKWAIFVLSTLAIIISIPPVVFTKVTTDNQTNLTFCQHDDNFTDYATAYNMLDTIFTIVIPLIVIFVLNGYISRTVWRLGSIRRKLTNRQSSRESYKWQKQMNGPKPLRSKPSGASHRKMTKMLLVVSTVCLSLNLPSYITRIVLFFQELEVIHVEDSNAFMNIQHIFMLMFYTNFGINFVLYCISGQNFRKAVKRMFNFSANLRRSDTSATDSTTLSTSASIVSKKRRTPIPAELQDFVGISSLPHNKTDVL